jgi:hypothetical protein
MEVFYLINWLQSFIEFHQPLSGLVLLSRNNMPIWTFVSEISGYFFSRSSCKADIKISDFFFEFYHKKINVPDALYGQFYSSAFSLYETKFSGINQSIPVMMTSYNQTLRRFLLDYLFVKHTLQQIVYNLRYGASPSLLTFSAGLKCPLV